MEVFRYSARSQDGNAVAGLVRATSTAEAALDLKRRGLFTTSITRRSISNFGFRIGARRRRSAHTFFRAFGVLIRAGVPIRRALVVVIENTDDRRFREALQAALSDVEHGGSLSMALSRRPREFSSLETAMIAAGEAGGILEDVLDRITALGDREHLLRKRMQSALVYPCVVAAGTGGLTLFLLFHVVPLFASMFERFGAGVPMPTQILLQIGRGLASPWTLALAIGFALSILAALRLFDQPASSLFDRARLFAPLVGQLTRHAITARIARTLGTLLHSGVGALDAIDVVAPVTGSQLYAKILLEIGDALRQGETLQRAMTASRLFDPLTLALTGVGEESGSLDAMLLSAASYLDIEVEAALTNIAALVEPALIGFLGLVVGGIVAAIFLPLYGLIGSIS